MKNQNFDNSHNADHADTNAETLADKNTGKKMSPRKAIRNTLAGTIAVTLTAVPLIPAAQALNAADEQPLQAAQQTDYKGSDLVEKFKGGASLTLAEIAKIDMDACKATDPQIAAKIIELKATLEAEAEKPVTPDVPTDPAPVDPVDPSAPTPSPEPGDSGEPGGDGSDNPGTGDADGSADGGADGSEGEQGEQTPPVNPDTSDDDNSDASQIVQINPLDTLPESMDPFEASENYPEWSYAGDTTFVTKHYTQDFTTEKFIAVLSVQAKDVAKDSGVAASAMIAQAVYATDGGRAQLSQAPTRNLFNSNDYTAVVVSQYDEFGNIISKNAGIEIRQSDRKQSFATYKQALTDFADRIGALSSNHSAQNTGGADAPAAQTAQLAQTDQAQSAQALSFDETLDLASAAYGLSADDVNAIKEIAQTYELQRFDEPDNYELASPIEITYTDNAGAKQTKQVDLSDLVAEATSYLGVPYVWGGTTPSGFDCSGLVQYSYAHALNTSLPRTTYFQCTQGYDVDFSDLHAGDLVFFQKNGVVGHVGMYIGEGCYIEAPQPGQEVKITSMDEKKPHFAKRIIPVV